MPNRPRVLVLAEPDPELSPPPLHLIPSHVEVVPVGSLPTDEDLAGASVLYIWDHRFADLAPILRRPNELRWVHAASVGVNRLICPELAAVTLTNSRGVFDTSIAEWVLAAVLAHVKGLSDSWALQREHTWQYRTTGRLAGTRAAVVGTGSIGRAIADCLARLDVHVTLVGRTGGDDPQFATIRSSDDLVDAVTTGTIAGAALDVFEIEPLPVGSPLWSMPNVLVSPHMSGDYVGFAIDMMNVFTDNLDRWLCDKPLHNVVDPVVGYVPH